MRLNGNPFWEISRVNAICGSQFSGQWKLAGVDINSEDPASASKFSSLIDKNNSGKGKSE